MGLTMGRFGWSWDCQCGRFGRDYTNRQSAAKALRNHHHVCPVWADPREALRVLRARGLHGANGCVVGVA